MILIPPNNQFTQPNKGDISGSLSTSFNLDLRTNKGHTRISPRMVLNVNETTLANLGVPCACRYFGVSGKYIWVAAGARMFYSTLGLDTQLTQDATGSTPTTLNSNQTDMEIFNGALYVSGAATSLYKLTVAGSWSSIAVVNNSSGLHAMTYFRATNRLYFVDDNSISIGSIDTSDTAATLGQQYTLQNLIGNNSTSIISWIKATSNRIWIGTINFQGGQAFVYSWDGSQSSGPNESYKLEANGSLSCVIKDDVPVIFDTNGRLLQLNGGTFTEIARLPVENKIMGTYFGTVLDRPVHYNGMSLIDGKVNVLVNTKNWDTNTTTDENIPSGIWEYDPDIGFYHKASLGLSTASGTITDFGQQKLLSVGMLSEIKVPSNAYTVGLPNGTFLAGANYYTNATADLNGLWYDDFKDTLQKYGYLVTPKIYSRNIMDSFSRAFIRFKKLLNSTDKIYLKWRVDDPEPVEATINWLTTTVFSTTASVSTFNGYEVEILQGIGGGKTAHITSVETSGSTYFCTVDETFTGVTAGATSIARFQNWTKAGDPFNNQIDKFCKWNLKEGGDTWIQLKVCALFTGKNEIDDLILINNPHTKAE